MDIIPELKMSQHSAQCRNNIIELLECLASEQKQLKYEEDVPNADVPFELTWELFNFYRRDLVCHKAFAEDERIAIEEFERFCQQRVTMLPENCDLQTLLANPFWREIMQEAQKTLEQTDVEINSKVKNYFNLIYADREKATTSNADELECLTCKTIINSHQKECPNCGWKGNLPD
ncbi:MAG: hypothetical protein ABJC04_11380 [Verrucomicrobiota bacterium]